MSMKLRKKTIVVVAGTFTILIILLYIFSQTLLLKSFETLEKRDMEHNLHMIMNSLENGVEGIDTITYDWAMWDDTYAFMDDHNKAYLESNITEETFISVKLNLIAYYDSSGKLIYGRAFDYLNEKDADMPGLFLSEVFSKDKILDHRDRESVHKGIVTLEEGTLFFSARPITKSSGEGLLRGTLIMGRYLDAATVDRFSKETYLPIKLLPYGTKALDADGVDALHFEKDGLMVLPLSESSILGLALIRDVYGKPALIVRTELEREIYAMGKNDIYYFMLYLLISGVILALVLILLIDKTVLSRIKFLGKSLSEVGSSGDLTIRIPTEGDDEISDLTGQVEDMLRSLEEFERMRKRAEASLAQSEERFRDIAENAECLIWEVDVEGRYTYVSPMCEKILGYKPEELVGKYFYDFIEPEVRDRITEKIKKAFAAKEPFLNVMTNKLHKDGSIVACETSGVPIVDGDGKLVGYRGSASNITRREQALEALARSETKYRTLFESSTDAVMLLDKKAFFDCNEATLHIFGCESRDEFLNKHPSELSPPMQPDGTDSMILANERIATAYKEGENQFEWMHRRLDGTDFPAEVWLTRMELDGKEVLQATVRDITDRKHAEEALVESEERYRQLIDNIDMGITLIDKDYNVVMANRYQGEMFNKPAFELVGTNCFREFEKREEVCAHCPGKKSMVSGKPEEVETQGVLDNGTLVSVHIKTFPIIGSDGQATGFIEVIENITDRKRLEEELYKAQKLESLGILAGGIAHDFNNLLTGILGNITIMKYCIDSEDQLYKRVEEVEKVTFLAGELTKQLLTFARGGDPVKEVVSLGDLIEESCSFALHGSNIKCDFAINKDLRPVEVDKGQFNQVINNLMINALHAMPEGGIIKVRSENTQVTKKENLPLKPGEYVLISIEDQGTGISSETLSKIFDPYFTTKKMGTGLGLATSFSIIKKHGGHIMVSSEMGRGTTFNIYLPITTKALVEKTAVEDEGVVIPGTGRVLIMDDEEVIRDVASQYLSHIGYKCETAEDGAEAIELYKTNKDKGTPFDIVIMDLTVKAGMGGEEAIKRLLEFDPEAKAIVSSGYYDDPVMSNHKKYGFCGVIPKPYTISDLSKLINKILK